MKLALAWLARLEALMRRALRAIVLRVSETDMVKIVLCCSMVCFEARKE